MMNIKDYIWKKTKKLLNKVNLWRLNMLLEFEAIVQHAISNEVVLNGSLSPLVQFESCANYSWRNENDRNAVIVWLMKTWRTASHRFSNRSMCNRCAKTGSERKWKPKQTIKFNIKFYLYPFYNSLNTVFLVLIITLSSIMLFTMLSSKSLAPRCLSLISSFVWFPIYCYETSSRFIFCKCFFR